MQLYEDGVCVATLVPDGAALGHVRVTPKQSVAFLADLPEEVAVQLFFVASFAATAVFEGLGAQGTNIVVQEGEALRLDVLSRKQEDGLDLFWEPKRAEPAELEQVAGKVKDALWYVGKEQQAPPVTSAPALVAQPAPKTEVPPADNYLLRQLQRKP